MSFSSSCNSGDKDAAKGSIKHSAPIAINTSARRARSVSLSSGSPSSDSASEAQTPSPTSFNSNRLPFPPASSSPILSYFLSQSPAKGSGTGTFPFSRKFGPPPVFEEPEDDEVPVAHHARRASTNMAGRFSQHGSASGIPEPQLERGSGLLRRLSLSSGAFARPPYEANSSGSFPPSTPPNSAVLPNSNSQPFSNKNNLRHTRSATINEGAKPRRAPSPMGERILKGHFDGFN